MISMAGGMELLGGILIKAAIQQPICFNEENEPYE